MLRRIRQLQRAFTLIEILVAMLILAIGLLGLAGLTVVVLRSNVLSQQISESTNIATDLVNRLRRVNYAALDLAIAGGCTSIDINDDANDGANPMACAAELTQAGVAAMDAAWQPTEVEGCTVAGVLGNDTRSFDVVQADLTAALDEAGDPLTGDNLCAFIDSDDFTPAHYLRFYRVIDEGNNRRLVVGVLFRDRFQRWRMTTLDTRRFP